MKKINLSFFVLPLLVMVMLGSCQKQLDVQKENGNASILIAGNNANLENQCRLLVDQGLSDGFMQSYHYNENGLADQVHWFKPSAFDFGATLEYGSRNEVTNAGFYYGADHYADIVFTYDKNKIATETWYIPGTNTQVDGYINSYNNQGQLIKRDEPDFELYALFNYDAKGNPVKIEIYDYQGYLYYGYELEYTTSIKNPFKAVPGMPESIFFTDAMEGPNRFSGLKQYFNDDQGNQVVFFHWKSEETELSAGDQNLAVYQNSRDDISDTWTDQVWMYENCSGNSESAHNSKSVKPSNGNKFMNLVRAKKTATYKQDILNFRKAYLNH